MNRTENGDNNDKRDSFLANKHKSNSHSNIFSAVSSVASRNSANFLPGNRFWTERKLQQRNRRQDDQKRMNLENDKYYSKVTAENQVYQNWESHHSLVKHSANSASHDHLAYNFMDPNTKDRIDQELRQECITKLTNLLTVHNTIKLEYEETKNSIESHNALKFLFDFKCFFQDIEKRRLKDMNDIRQHLYEQPHNASRDPLRRVCFLIQGLLSFNKDSIIILLNQLKKLRKFLSDNEQNELNELNNRCLLIMDMYLQMNDLRNEHFFGMYSEEKEELWPEQKAVWRSEMNIWDGLMCKLLQSNYQIVFSKLNKHITNCNELLNKRLNEFDHLQRYFIEIQNNAFLRTALQKDVSYFKI